MCILHVSPEYARRCEIFEKGGKEKENGDYRPRGGYLSKFSPGAEWCREMRERGGGVRRRGGTGGKEKSSLARALMGFYERRVAKERPFREINTRRASELVKKYNRYFRTDRAPLPLVSHAYTHTFISSRSHTRSLSHSLPHSPPSSFLYLSLSLMPRLLDCLYPPDDEVCIPPFPRPSILQVPLAL